jgi:hypothetical protein
MTTRVIKSELERRLLMTFIARHPLPFTVDVVKGKRRSVEQNRLQRLLVNEIAEQLGDQTAEEVRGYCKLRFGVPILRAESTAFAERYDAIVKPLPYESKLAFMMEPLDLPVTRLMTTEQKTRYIDAIYQHFLEQGLVLTAPDASRSAVHAPEQMERAG